MDTNKYSIQEAKDIVTSETISREDKIKYLRAYNQREYIPSFATENYDYFLLFVEGDARPRYLEFALESAVRYTPFNELIQKFIDLAFQLKLDIHNIINECMVYETFLYALDKGFVPKHFNYLNSYLIVTSYTKKNMIELRFSITPKDTLFKTSVSSLIQFYYEEKEHFMILFECVEARLKAGYFFSDYCKPFGTSLIKLNEPLLFQLLIDYQYPFTDGDIKLALKINPDNLKRLIYGGIIPGGDHKFSWDDFITYAGRKTREIFGSFFTSTVAKRDTVLGSLSPELEQLIIQQYLGFHV